MGKQTPREFVHEIGIAAIARRLQKAAKLTFDLDQFFEDPSARGDFSDFYGRLTTLDGGSTLPRLGIAIGYQIKEDIFCNRLVLRVLWREARNIAPLVVDGCDTACDDLALK